MQDELRNVSHFNGKLQIHFNLQFVRQNKDTDSVKHSIERSVQVGNELARQILSAISTPGSQFEVPNILPYFLVVPTEGKIRDAEQLASVFLDSKNAYNYSLTYSNATFRMSQDRNKNSLWTMQFKANETEQKHMFNVERVDYGSAHHLTYIPMTFFVDRQFPSLLSQVAKGSVATMYVAIVYVIARFVRTFISTNPLDIIISELPNPDHILKICLDIYLVREARNFVLEEDLFARLIFLLRSPATLIKWSRPKMD